VTKPLYENASKIAIYFIFAGHPSSRLKKCPFVTDTFFSWGKDLDFGEGQFEEVSVVSSPS
jgi:hypothetical protein